MTDLKYNRLDEEEQSLIIQSDHTPFKKNPGTSDTKVDLKLVSFFFVGFITLIYVVAELAAAIYLDSLVLLSDGFHNLSDVISLYIAYWARQATKRGSSDEMSYGWVRTEVLGGLTNGCCLLSLVVYVILESIPKFIKPTPIESGILFIIISGSGLAINTIGTIIFSLTGNEHGHSHSHGGGGHSHGHGHSEKKEKKEGHSHGHGHKEKKEKNKPSREFSGIQMEDHHHHEEEGHSHGHAHEHSEKKEKKEKKEGHSHGHEHKEKKEKKEGHSHGHGHDHKDKKEKKKPRRDENVHAVFLHYLGDAISSLMVLTAGILLHFFHKTNNRNWTWYIDPVSSLIVCALILYTTIPLVKRCSLILLQNSGGMEVSSIRKKLAKIEGVIGVHDLHVWQLVDGMSVASVHIAAEEGVDFNTLVTEVKEIFHKFGVHSSSIQPEFVPRNFATAVVCGQHCVKECDEDWCCKKTAENLQKLNDEYSIRNPL